MTYDRESILQQYPAIITDILKATKENPEDEEAHARVALSLVRSLSDSKRRTGKNVSPQDTELYKLAWAVQQADTTEELDALLKETLPKAGKGILTKYKLDWNLPGARKRKGRVAREAAPAQGASTSDIIARIENIELSLSRIEKQLSTLEEKRASGKLSKQIEEIHQKLKLHQHDREDGRAYLIEKKEV
jgi:hypothetical protein